MSEKISCYECGAPVSRGHKDPEGRPVCEECYFDFGYDEPNQD